MVADFIHRNALIFRIVLLLTILMMFLTLNASDINVKNLLISKETSSLDVIMMRNLPTIKLDESNYGELQNLDLRKITKVVIDAGHGGNDSGCVGKNSIEKELTLKIALLVGELIKSKYPDVKVLQTRTTDVFIPLFRRIQYANEENADLFISIHCNFISNPKVRGTETFVMGLHRASDNLEVAKRENSSILLEQNYEQNYDGYDPNSSEGHIMMSMYQNAYLDSSIEFANDIESDYKINHPSKSRGVKQAGFAVLRRSSMPAVLTEIGFLSNAEEEEFLLSANGQKTVATSILMAFDKFYIKNSSLDHIVKEKVRKVESTSKVNPDVSVIVPTQPKYEVKSNAIAAPTLGLYSVQIAAIREVKADMDSADLAKVGALRVVKVADMYKYLVGSFPNREQAVVAQRKLQNLGYKGAFLVINN